MVHTSAFLFHMLLPGMRQGRSEVCSRKGIGVVQMVAWLQQHGEGDPTRWRFALALEQMPAVGLQ